MTLCESGAKHDLGTQQEQEQEQEHNSFATSRPTPMSGAAANYRVSLALYKPQTFIIRVTD